MYTAILPKVNELLDQAEAFLNKGDLIEAAKRAYEAVKEVIIHLAKKYNLEEAKQAGERGAWDFGLLDASVGKLDDILGKDVLILWSTADSLKLSAEDGILDVETAKVDFKI